MPFEILFVMLIEAIVFSFALGIQFLHDNEKTVKYFGGNIQLRSKGNWLLVTAWFLTSLFNLLEGVQTIDSHGITIAIIISLFFL